MRFAEQPWGAAWICGGPGLGKKRAETIRYGVERKADGWRVTFEAGQSAFISSLACLLRAKCLFGALLKILYLLWYLLWANGGGKDTADATQRPLPMNDNPWASR